jgi:hypothetical protein
MTIAIIVQNKYPFYPFETKCQLLSLPFSVGNLNEGILLANLLNASKEDDGRRTLFSVSSIYRPGMVEKKMRLTRRLLSTALDVLIFME